MARPPTFHKVYINYNLFTDPSNPHITFYSMYLSIHFFMLWSYSLSPFPSILISLGIILFSIPSIYVFFLVFLFLSFLYIHLHNKSLSSFASTHLITWPIHHSLFSFISTIIDALLYSTFLFNSYFILPSQERRWQFYWCMVKFVLMIFFFSSCQEKSCRKYRYKTHYLLTGEESSPTSPLCIRPCPLSRYTSI